MQVPVGGRHSLCSWETKAAEIPDLTHRCSQAAAESGRARVGSSACPPRRWLWRRAGDSRPLPAESAARRLDSWALAAVCRAGAVGGQRLRFLAVNCGPWLEFLGPERNRVSFCCDKWRKCPAGLSGAQCRFPWPGEQRCCWARSTEGRRSFLFPAAHVPVWRAEREWV